MRSTRSSLFMYQLHASFLRRTHLRVALIYASHIFMRRTYSYIALIHASPLFMRRTHICVALIHSLHSFHASYSFTWQLNEKMEQGPLTWQRNKSMFRNVYSNRLLEPWAGPVPTRQLRNSPTGRSLYCTVHGSTHSQVTLITDTHQVRSWLDQVLPYKLASTF